MVMLDSDQWYYSAELFRAMHGWLQDEGWTVHLPKDFHKSWALIREADFIQIRHKNIYFGKGWVIPFTGRRHFPATTPNVILAQILANAKERPSKILSEISKVRNPGPPSSQR